MNPAPNPASLWPPKGRRTCRRRGAGGGPGRSRRYVGTPGRKGGGGGTPRGSSAHSDALRGWGPPGYGAARNPPHSHPSSIPWAGMGMPMVQPPVIFPWAALPGCLPAGKTLLGGSQPPPPTLQHPRAPSHPGKGSGPPFAPPRAAAESAFADGLIKAPLAKAAQRDKMLPEPL